MLRYVIRRLIGVVVMLWVISIATFLLFFALPVNPAALSCGKTCTPAIIKQVESKFGLDKPLYVQYGTFMKGIFVGRDFGVGGGKTHCPAPCLGMSYHDPSDVPVTSLITDAFPVTFSIVLGG